ncbi:MAG: hypothetical protein B6I20_11315 [Bacteroidetes bacterium 4572_117]|nr:MAG: hypothetical protein B6I20_11315 [Bacteroidetes bacterium 4572_117]
MGLISSYKKRKRLYNLEKDIIAYFSNNKINFPDEFIKAVDYIKQNGLQIFPHNFKDKYIPENVEVFTDKKVGLNYIFYEGKKLYYRKKRKIRETQNYFNGLYIEQDIQSPHRYLTNKFNVDEGDVVVDIGAAEGNFALSVVESAKEIYLFETNKRWIKALEATFAPWKEKVHIIQKYVSDKDDAFNTTIDALYKRTGKIDFIKADVEGAESKVIKGCRALIKNQKHIKIAVCTYHKQDDEQIFTKQFSDLGFGITKPDNYIIFHDDLNIKPPYFRRGLIRAIR